MRFGREHLRLIISFMEIVFFKDTLRKKNTKNVLAHQFGILTAAH